MKRTHVFRALLISSLISHLSYLSPAALKQTHDPLPLPSFTFAGRVVDYAHVAYDADQKVEIRVLDAAGNLIAKGQTFTSGKTTYNFAVDVPISDLPAQGSVTNGTPVKITFIDPDGEIYEGLVLAGDATIGKPGEMKTLNVALGTDSDHDGVTDEYVDALAYLMWKNGKSAYDANADWDGDGANNRQEYIAGTSPFDAKDRFSVRQMAVDEGYEDYLKLTFLANQGRTYSVTTKDDLAQGDWRGTSFKDEKGETGVSITTGGTETGFKTIYVLKENLKQQFWKLKVD